MSDNIRLTTALRLYEIDESIKDDLAYTEAHKLPVVAVYALNELYRQDGQCTSELGTAVGNLSTSFSWIITRLESDGFVARIENTNDRRSSRVHLTDKGKRLQRAIEHALANVEVRYGGG